MTQTSASSAPQVPAPPAPPAPFGISPEQQVQIRELVQQQTAMARELQQQAQAAQGGITVPTVGSGPGGIPMNEQEMKALRSQRAELSNQLNSAADRRKSLVRELTSTGNDVARAGLEARISVLDNRIIQLEREIDRTGRLVLGAPARLQGITGQQTPQGESWRPNDGAIIAISVVFTLAVLMPLAITAARVWWRRATGQAPSRRSRAEENRFEQLQQAVDSIAIEMERVSEGQRFVTRLLTEGRGEIPALGAARGEAVPVQQQR